MKNIPLVYLISLCYCCRGFNLNRHRTYAQLMHHSSLRSRNATELMQQFSPDASNISSCRTVRILCLHGKGGNGKRFVSKSLAPLRKLLQNRLEQMNAEHEISFQWDFLTAPFEIPSGKIINEDGKGFSWWSMPPGVRSFNAVEYEGFSQSEDLVMNTIYLNEECKYDIIFGHSQGAILTAALLSLHDKLRFGSTSPSGFIFNGAAWPNPYSESMQGLSGLAPEKSFKGKSPKMLFIMGKADDINPIDSATRVSNVFNDTGFDVTIVEHDGGHSVPYNNDVDSLRAMGEVVDWIMSVS